MLAETPCSYHIVLSKHPWVLGNHGIKVRVGTYTEKSSHLHGKPHAPNHELGMRMLDTQPIHRPAQSRQQTWSFLGFMSVICHTLLTREQQTTHYY